MKKSCLVCVLLVIGCFSIMSFAKTGREDREKASKDFYEHNYQKALTEFQQSIAVDEENHRKHHRDESTASRFGAPYLAITYAKLGDFDKALESWNSYVSSQPLPPDAPQVDARISDPETRNIAQRLLVRIHTTRTYYFHWPYYYGIADMLRHAGLTDSADKVENEGRIFLEATVAGDKAGYRGGGDGASAARARVFEAENRPQYAQDERESETEVRQAEADYKAQHPYQPSTLDMIIAGLNGGGGNAATTDSTSSSSSTTSNADLTGQDASQTTNSLRNGGVDAQACLAQRESLNTQADSLGTQFNNCENSEQAKQKVINDRISLDHPQTYCTSTFPGLKVQTAYGAAKYSCYACKNLAAAAYVASHQRDTMDCSNVVGVH